MSNAIEKVKKSWERQASLETILYNEIQLLRGIPKQHGSQRDNALLETLPVIKRVIKKYEKLMGMRLWAGERPRCAPAYY